jgi:beta-mannosidase
LTQQLLRLGSHASLAVFGGNNEVEQSLEWYGDTKGNLGLYAADYSTMFEHTIGKVAQKVSVEHAGHISVVVELESH